MKHPNRPLIPALAALALLCACGGESAPPAAAASDTGTDAAEPDAIESDAIEPDAAPEPTSGELRVLTYNVAGLPQGLSSSEPEAYIPQISPLLSAYDLVLVQEDFWYHAELSADVTLPHRSEPAVEAPNVSDMGDGLNRFSVSAFELHTRTPWPGCNGTVDCSSDCLANKGMSFARHTLAPGVEVDVYNLHNEAGGCPDDLRIRDESTDLLIDTIASQSAGRAVIVGGDFNLREADAEDLPLLTRLWDDGLRDVCHEVSCGTDEIDRIMIRDGDVVRLEALEWSFGEEFVTSAGEDLSDHPAVWARVGWSRAR